MLVLSSFGKLLAQVLSPPDIHTAVLFTTTGELISFVSSAPESSKDDVRVLVGLASEVWSETREDGEGMVDSEIGRVVVLPIASAPENGGKQQQAEPLLLIAINSTENVEWGKLKLKAKGLANHLARPLGDLQDKFGLSRSSTPAATKSSRSTR